VTIEQAIVTKIKSMLPDFALYAMYAPENAPEKYIIYQVVSREASRILVGSIASWAVNINFYIYAEEYSTVCQSLWKLINEISTGSYADINAACRLNDMKYSQFIHGLSLAGIELDRKSLADIAVKQPETFAPIAGQARDAIGKQAQATA
jgi:hypothetical protein